MTKPLRFWVQMRTRAGMFSVLDRSYIIPELRDLDAISAEFICEALNAKHALKVKHRAA